MRRRTFTTLLAAFGAQLALLFSPFRRLLRWARAQSAPRRLAADTPLDTLLYEDPATLDASLLPVTPIDQCGVSNAVTTPVDIDRWRLRIGGAVAHSYELDYSALLALPALERNELLICPGTFAFHARWRGVHLWPLLQRAGIESAATHLDVIAADTTERFPLAEIRSGKVFLAHGINGEKLPRPHGYPARLVAPGHVGAEWVKYVDRIEAVAAPATLPPAPAAGSDIVAP